MKSIKKNGVNISQFTYSALFLGIISLSVYAMYINSLMPRLWGIVLFAFMLLLHLSKKNQHIRDLKQLAMIFVTTFLVSALSVVLVGNPNFFSFDGIWYMLQLSIYTISGAIVAIRVDKNNRVKLYKCMLLLLLISILVDFTGSYITYDDRHYSIFANALLYGSFILIAFHLAFFLINNIFLKTVVMLICTYACIITYSRSAWLAMIVTFLIDLFITKGEQLTVKQIIERGVLILAIIIVFVFYGAQIEILIYGIMGAITNKISGVFQSSSAVFRLDAISYLFKASSPVTLIFGNGVGMSKTAITNAGISISRFRTADNQYVSFLFEFGLVGLYWMIQLIKNVGRNLVGKTETPDAREKIMLASIILSIMITGFFFDVFGNANLSTAALSMFGILYQLDRMQNSGEVIG